MGGSYRKWLAARGRRVTPEQAAEHRHLVEDAVPLCRAMREFLDRHGRPDMPIPKVDPDEARQLQQAIDIIEGAAVPVSLLEIEEDPAEARRRLWLRRGNKNRSRCVYTDEDEENK